ncbi:conserved hypothetical protein [delta proteobacterium NaphS2]|nr:conserved hypothetical protein [delta proteobacterium NaphS2]
MDITILGSGTAIPMNDRGSPSLAVFFKNRAVLFDMGPGTLCRMARLGLGPERIETIFLTHYRVRTAPAEHTPRSLAYRLENANGKSVVISGDTDYSDAIIRLAQGADLLILKAALPDNQPLKGHLTPSLAGRMAHLAGVKRLVLTHFYPECLRTDIAAQCRRTWQGELTLAEDLLQICV